MAMVWLARTHSPRASCAQWLCQLVHGPGAIPCEHLYLVGDSIEHLPWVHLTIQDKPVFSNQHKFPPCEFEKNLIFQVLEELVFDLIIKQLKQHQNTKEDKFIVCLNKAVKNFPPLADR